MDTTLENPYVGPRTFQREERHLFFGRDREARDLSALVASEKLVLFYAQSGAGKSSLINTCLIPELVENLYEVLPIARVTGEVPDGGEIDNIYVYNLMRSLIRREIEPKLLASLTLSQFLGRLNEDEAGYYYDGSLAAPIRGSVEGATWRRALIIDQFEELFSTHQGAWEKREDFFKQLAEAMKADSYLWVVLVMREDYIAALDPYAHFLPGGLRTRYYMQRLSRAAAIKAVKSPAEKLRPYEPDVAEDLVENLASVKVPRPDGQLAVEPGQYVEPVQMQVVCYSLWENLPPGRSTITADDLREVGDINQALEKFYDGRVAAVARDNDVEERLIREWFNDELITIGGIRNIVLGDQHSGGLDEEVIRALQGDLVRAEMRAGQVWYELSHDRLVEPVRSSNAKWFAANLSIFQQQAALWETQGRPDGTLLRGKELEQARLEAASKKMTRDERDFLDACVRVAEREQREQRANRWVRILAVAASLALLAAVFLAINATRQAQVARDAGASAVTAVTAAAYSLSTAQAAIVTAAAANQIIEADKLAGQAQLALGQPDSVRLGQLLSVAAYRKTTTTESGKFLPNVYQALFDSVTRGHDLPLGRPIRIAAFSPGATVQWLVAEDVLWNLKDRQEIDLPIDSAELVQAAFQSDEELVLVVRSSDFYDTTYIVYIWNTVTQSEISFFLEAPDMEINDVYLSDNGRWLVTYGLTEADGVETEGVQLWDVDELGDNPPRRFTVARGQTIYGVTITPDGTQLAVAVDNYLYLWSNAENEILVGTENTLNPDFRLDTPPSISDGNMLQGSGQILQFSLDGNWLALLTEDSLNFYDLRNEPKQSPDLIALERNVPLLGFRFAPDNQYVLYVTSTYSTCRNQPGKDCKPKASVLRWPLGEPNPKADEIYSSTTADLTALDIGLDKLVIGDSVGYVRTWAWPASQADLPVVTSAHSGAIDRILIAPDNLMAISSSSADEGRLWELSERGNDEAVITHRISNDVSSLVRSENGNVLAIGGASGENTVGSNIRVYSGVQAPGTLSDAPYNAENGYETELGVIALHDQWIAAARTDRTGNFQSDEVYLLDLWKRDSAGSGPGTFELSAKVTSLAFYPDGAYLMLATNNGGGTADIWVYQMNYLETVLPALSTAFIPPMPEGYKIETELHTIQSLRFTQNGESLIAASADGVQAWNTTQNPPKLVSLENAVYPANLSPDQVWLVTAGSNNVVQLFDLKDLAATPTVVFPLSKAAIGQFAFNRSGDLLAVSDKSGKISIYQFPITSDAAMPVYTLLGPTSEISSLEFSSPESMTGNWFAASSERAVYLWNLAYPNERPITVQGHNGNVLYAGFTEDGQWIVTVAQDRTLKFWSLDLESVSRTVCQFAGQNLTRAEWVSYVQQPYTPENADICGYGVEN